MKLKLKHKKLIVIASLIVLGVGTLTFSLINNDGNKEVASNKVGESEGEALNQLDAESQIASFTRKDSDLGDDNSTQDTTAAAVQEPELEVNADEEVVQLINNYMSGKLEPCVEVFTPLVNDVSLVNVEAMERETIIIEKYDNVTVYSIDTPQEGTSLVYANHDVKFVGIDTSAPAATRFLVVKDDDKAPYIFNGEVSEVIKEFISEFEQSSSYDELVKEVNTKLTSALNQDKELEELYSRLYESNTKAEATEAEESVETQETQETQAAEATANEEAATE